jgi:hypothetical protein
VEEESASAKSLSQPEPVPPSAAGGQASDPVLTVGQVESLTAQLTRTLNAANGPPADEPANPVTVQALASATQSISLHGSGRGNEAWTSRIGLAAAPGASEVPIGFGQSLAGELPSADAVRVFTLEIGTGDLGQAVLGSS